MILANRRIIRANGLVNTPDGVVGEFRNDDRFGAVLRVHELSGIAGGLSASILIVCPAMILANRRIIRANGLVNTPKNSTKGMIGNDLYHGIDGVVGEFRNDDRFGAVLRVHELSGIAGGIP